MGYRRDIEQQLSDPEQSHRIAELRQQLAAAIEAEEQLTVASQREQARADAFRTGREVLKARYTAARAEYLVEEASGQDTAEAADRPACPRSAGGCRRAPCWTGP